MKIVITLKDPDGVWDSIEEAVRVSIESLEGIDDEEREDLQELRFEQAREDCSKFIEYSEYVTIEIDTEAGTATVLEV